MKVFNTYLLLLTIFITSCKSGEQKDVIKEEPTPLPESQTSLKINSGGYSWWSGEYLQQSKIDSDNFYVTGVGVNNNSSQQWLTKFTLNEKGFNLVNKVDLLSKFKADEHNSPSVLTIEDYILVALTGHGDDFDPEVANKVIVYSGKKIDSMETTVLDTDAPSTYVSLVAIGDDILLFSRIEQKGLSYSVSSDFGKSWSKFRSVLGRGYYADVKVDPTSQELYFFIGVHPNNPKSSIKVARAYFNGDQILPFHIEDANEQGVLKGSSYTNVYTAPIEHDARIVVAKHIRSIGERNSAYANDYYVYGGSLNYKNEDNLEAVFAYKRENHFYIDKVNIDLNSLIISSNTNILDSPLELYRPIIFESHDRTLLMFNEAAYWINYFDWQASQTIIKLE